jgi:carbohydrate ABC transporter membrane protein 2, CUT1 family (TC 3.A.1.1.-)
MERQNPIFRLFLHVAALLLAAVILAPLLWLFVMSISPAADLAAKPLRWWPATMDFSRYATLLSTLENSAGAAFTASLGTPDGGRHGHDRRRGAGGSRRLGVSRTPSVGWSLSLVIATYMLPPVAWPCRSTWRSPTSACSTACSAWRWSTSPSSPPSPPG